MHDTVRNATSGGFDEGSIDAATLEALMRGELTIEDVLRQERARLQRQLGLEEVEHACRPAERPFTRRERDTTTVLFGGLTWKHERLIQASLHAQGYRTAYLPTPRLESLQLGKEYGNSGMCNPTYFTVGNLLRYLMELEAQGLSREDIINSYVFFTAGACGPCRFGMYENEYRLALRNAGFEGFRVLILEQTGGLDQSVDNAGLEMNLDFTLGIINAFLIADLLNDLAYRCRPYEMEEGSTDNALAESIELVASTLERLKPLRLPDAFHRLRFVRTAARAAEVLATFTRQLAGRTLTGAMDAARERFSAVQVDRTRVKPVVKITGEFWAQTTEGDGNFNMFPFLEREGAEVMIEPITPWLLYMLHQEKQSRRDRRFLDIPSTVRGIRRVTAFAQSMWRYTRTSVLLSIAERLLLREYSRMRSRIGDAAQDIPDQRYFAGIAHPYFNTRIEGGEGHLEIAKTMYYTERRLAHMVLSLKPFGCMPSTQSDGVQSAVTAHNSDIIFLPVETAGEGEVNAHSRVQMTLNDARQRAQAEFEAALTSCTMTEAGFRRAAEELPDGSDPFFQIPHDGRAAGTAARFVYAIAGNHGRTGEAT
jgi:predicted nucleotide-binding protein (sugar kinase/HSP70/actin superfamily)